jgi:hypothetical protein
MKVDKNDLSKLSTRALLTRRRRLAARLGDVEALLAGSLVETPSVIPEGAGPVNP